MYLGDGDGQTAKSHISENNDNHDNRDEESSEPHLRLHVARDHSRSGNEAFLGVHSRTDDVALGEVRLLERLLRGLGLLDSGVESSTILLGSGMERSAVNFGSGVGSSTGVFGGGVENPTSGIFRGCHGFFFCFMYDGE